MNILLILSICLISISFVSASVTVRNSSVKTIYGQYETFSGTINLTISNEGLSSNITSSLGGKMSIINFLNNNSASYSCNPYDCEHTYTASNSEQTKEIFLSGDSQFGFVLNGNSVSDINLNFNISSSFGKSSEIPLRINFFDTKLWNFTIPSNDYSMSVSSGCYGDGDVEYKNITSSYAFCEKVFAKQASSFLLGANITGTDNKQLKMYLYNLNLAPLGTCDIALGSNSCILNATSSMQTFEEADYYVCVGLKTNSGTNQTNYQIASENSEDNCGWFVSLGSIGNILSTSSSRDYSIFLKTPKYAEARTMRASSIFPTISADVRQYIQTKYSNNCSQGCIIPISISGVDQNFVISNVALSYIVANEGPESSNSVYNIEPQEAKVSFSGVLDLSKLGFNVSSKGNKTMIISFAGRNLVDKRINVVNSAIINAVYPLNPLAGVPIQFTADVTGNASLYVWDFGDGVVTTTTNKAVHSYSGLGVYTLTLNVTGNGIISSKSFAIVTGSPTAVINTTIYNKRLSITHTLQDIAKYPAWIKTKLENLTEVNLYLDELNRLERQKNLSSNEEELVNITLAIVNLNVPYSVYNAQSMTLPLITSLEDIKPEIVKEFAGGNEDDFEEYKNPILQWQKQYTVSNISVKKIEVVKQDSQIVPGIFLYSINVKNNFDKEVYFIINKPAEQLVFNNLESRRVTGAALIIIPEEGEKLIEFYSSDEPKFFISPKLNQLQAAINIENCDNDKICEEGEDSSNCPNDCKSYTKAIIYVIIVLIIGIFLYTLVAIWYKARYEAHLFKDRKYLFNLLMFIANARARGMSDYDIKKKLSEQGWNSEQMNYAIRKSLGKRTGMPEIIPITKISSYFMNKKAKENINKQQIQGINRW